MENNIKTNIQTAQKQQRIIGYYIRNTCLPIDIFIKECYFVITTKRRLYWMGYRKKGIVKVI